MAESDIESEMPLVDSEMAYGIGQGRWRDLRAGFRESTS